MAGKRNTYRQRRAKRPKKMTAHARAVLIVTLATAATFAALACCGHQFHKSEEARYEAGRPHSVCLLNVELPDETPEIKLAYNGFDVSFNPSHHQPNYSAWELTAEKANGQLPRKSKFAPDNDVYGCATLEDYRNSGFDRGHMVPAGDMKWDINAMEDSHLLTNICPQDHALNGGRWASLENKCREWVQRDSLLVIICGPILSDRMPRTIGRSAISVPERFFKVIFAPYANPPRAIGFIMPNSAPQEGLESLAVSVDNVEEITGFDFFSCLPDDIESEVESQVNYRIWNRRKR